MADANEATAAHDVIDWAGRLIAIDTVSTRSNLGLIEEVSDYLKGFGLTPIFTYDDQGAKANLFATIPGRRGGLRGGVLLSGHTDVVPVVGQDWSFDPFTPRVQDGRLYGRGACDMKGFLGCALALVPHFLDRDLQEPVHLALSYDEEVGCLGAPRMIEQIIMSDVRPKHCVVGEPTNMMAVSAHKGLRRYRCRVHGRAAHSSLVCNGVNAIEYAAKVIRVFTELVDQARVPGLEPNYFDPPFSSGCVAQIVGGITQNIIPELCEFVFECRPVPGFDMDGLEERLRKSIDHEIHPAMRQRYPEAGVEIARLCSVPGFMCDESNAFLHTVRKLTGSTDIQWVAYGTEAGHFAEAGMSTVVCGPGDIAQAHRPDEFVTLDQLDRCRTFLMKLVQ